ncbi:MAG TPA: hypothetical protein P5081_01285 [Phycisphaerae bacterium]|nr:hypothetical protein [Phycisphaerae bacterium]HRW51487.1 hypothetical protein [Phycisphaerae bacterium]
MAPETSRSNPVRIHQVRIRDARLRAVDSLLVLTALAVGDCFSVNVVTSHNQVIRGNAPGWLATTRLALAIASPSLLCGHVAHRLLVRRRWRLSRREDAWRHDRLCRVVAHREAMSRLPHRVWEYFLRERTSSPKEQRRLRMETPPGHIIILLNRAGDRGAQRRSPAIYQRRLNTHHHDAGQRRHHHVGRGDPAA